MLELGLDSTNALVVGAGQGIGRATALALAEAGCHVACIDTVVDRNESVVNEIRAYGRSTVAVHADVTDSAQVDAAVVTATDALGPITVCADIVGMARWGQLLDTSDDDWRATIALVLDQQFFVARSVCRQMVAHGAGGSFVAIASISALSSAPNHGPYGAAKAGVSALVKTLAIELAPHGIRANAVSPGLIATPRVMERATHDDWLGSRQPALVPLGNQRGTPEDIARTVAFLSSSLARHITGQTIVVDGGITSRFPLSER
jgi:NAD(P)-dependent dehydrogenase (short-subunit alcohol dehydrogenase family)